MEKGDVNFPITKEGEHGTFDLDRQEKKTEVNGSKG